MTALITIHFIVIILFIGIVLLQKNSKGIVGSNNMNDMKNIFSKEDSKNIVSRITTFLAIAFFITSMLLAIISISSQKSIINDIKDIEIPIDNTNDR